MSQISPTFSPEYQSGIEQGGYDGSVENRKETHHRHHASWILGLLGICSGVLGYVAFGVVFFALALILSVIGFILGVRHNSRSVIGIVLSTVAWIVIIAGSAALIENPNLSGFPQPVFSEL